jgi:bifunctional UDP-N-acetylglucosamine pyrophosphorylase/glucosamine-1-phosphate N-acetyltransferase
MKVILLAAGRSKRMKPVEDKNFLNFLGKPLIQWQLEMLNKIGVEEVILVGGKHNLDRLGEVDHEFLGNIEIVEQKDLDAGMCGGVLAAKDLITNEPTLIVSSNDVVEEKAFVLIKEAFEKGDADSYILGKKVSEYFPGGYLDVDEEGVIAGIVEKPEPGTEPSDMINLVVHLHKDFTKLVKYLEKTLGGRDDRYEVALDAMIKDGVKMKAVEYEGFWQGVKFPWHVHEVFKHFVGISEKRISESAEISEYAVVEGDVIIGENVRIFEGAVVRGPCYIGDGSVIANNALVRESHVGENCVIGFATEVARSFLGRDVWTHSNYIGDSVIGNNVSFGAGTVTGNLRLDEKNICVDLDGNKIDCGTNKFGLVCGDNVRVGVNTSFMPGVKIGTGSFIGAGIVISQNIDENSFVRGAWDLKISKNKVNVDRLNREEVKNKLKNE